MVLFKRYKCLLFLFVVFQFCGENPLFAQNKRAATTSSLSAIGSVDSCGCVIRLRWNTDDPYAWNLANTYGYLIERYTVSVDGQLLPRPVKTRITAKPLKPKPLKEWETICQQDDNAAILAQGIYGTDFEVTSSAGKLASIVNQSNSLTQRFTFSAMAADRSFPAACMAALGYCDTTVRAREKYLYKIYPNFPKEKAGCDTALVYIGGNDYTPPPKPADVYAAYGDQTVLISWDTKLLKAVYSAYSIERSDNGLDFKPLSPLPFATLNDNKKEATGRAFYIDTIQNGRSYSYRIKGITPFGEYGPPSDMIKGAGMQLMAFVPNIKEAGIVNDSTAILTWEFPDEGASVVDHFELERSLNNAENSFQTVVAHIAATQRQIRFYPLAPSNYFTVTAVDKNGNKRTSFPYLVQPIDSLPPAVPYGLSARIDSLGKVTLAWQANHEPDLLGYVVFRSNNKNEEPSVVNSKPFSNTIFEENIDLKTLNNKIFYSVAALDRRMNQSKPSVRIAVEKPDKIPPSAPLLADYKISDNGKPILFWVNSPSDDVAAHLLLRKVENDTAWTTVARLTDRQTTNYEDTLSSSEAKMISYSIRAIDRSGNLSPLSPPLKIAIPTPNKNLQLKNLRTDIDRSTGSITVSWRVAGADVAEYTIYKACNKAAYTTWKVLAGNYQFVADQDISVGNTYKYAIRPLMKNGKYGEWKEVRVEY